MAETYRSMFCTYNNPEWIITYEHNPDGTLKYNADGSPKIFSQEPSFLNGLIPEEICKTMAKLWCDSKEGRTCAVAYCISATGLVHLHMVLECDSNHSFRFSEVKKLFPKIHCEPTRGSKDQAENYINKKGKYAEKGEKVIYVEQIGEIQGNQGNRSDYVQMQEMIDNGMTPDEIMDTNIRYRRYEKMIKDAYNSKRRKETAPLRDVAVYWYVGETGTGKTYKYVELVEDGEQVYMPPDLSQSGAFDRYNGESILLINEFRGEIPFRTFLGNLEGYKTQIHARYTDQMQLWDEVFITSPFTPFEVYPNLESADKKDQLYRRIDKIIYCYKEEDKENIYYNKIIMDCNEYMTQDTFDMIINFIKPKYKKGKCIDDTLPKLEWDVTNPAKKIDETNLSETTVFESDIKTIEIEYQSTTVKQKHEKKKLRTKF